MLAPAKVLQAMAGPSGALEFAQTPWVSLGRHASLHQGGKLWPIP